MAARRIVIEVSGGTAYIKEARGFRKGDIVIVRDRDSQEQGTYFPDISKGREGLAFVSRRRLP